jgi:hypothetical protein
MENNSIFYNNTRQKKKDIYQVLPSRWLIFYATYFRKGIMPILLYSTTALLRLWLFVQR